MGQTKPRPVRPGSRDDDLVARAEAAVARLSRHFSGWMQNECRRLEERCRRVEANPGNAKALDRLYSAAHDIKGEASTFGFALVERVAASLCRLMSEAPERTRIPFALIAQHVAVLRQALEPSSETQAQAARLEQTTARYLADAGRGDDYPNVKGPPLAPGE